MKWFRFPHKLPRANRLILAIKDNTLFIAVREREYNGLDEIRPTRLKEAKSYY